MEVKTLTDQDVERWEAYVAQAPAATFFHRAGWRTVLEQAFGHRAYFLYAEEQGKIVGILPLAAIRSRIFGDYLGSTPFCVYGGVVSDRDDVQQALEDKAVELARELKVGSLEIRNQQPVHQDWPAKRELYVTFKKEIDPDLEKNMSNIPRKQRAMVRKGIQAGLESHWDQNVDRLHDAYSQSVHALGTPVFSKKYFEVLQQVFADDCRVLTVTHEGKLVASVMNFYFRDQVLPYYGGGTPLARETKGNDFMYWEVMRDACERGYKVFDYGRSKVNTGAYSFKKNWGFEPQPLHYEYVLINDQQVPDVSPANPKYAMFIKIWQKLPLGLTRIIGPHIVKNLG